MEPADIDVLRAIDPETLGIARAFEGADPEPRRLLHRHAAVDAVEAHPLDADVVRADLHETVEPVVVVVGLLGGLHVEQTDAYPRADLQEAVDVARPRGEPDAQHVNPRPRADLETDRLAGIARGDLEDRVGEPVLAPALDDVAPPLADLDPPRVAL